LGLTYFILLFALTYHDLLTLVIAGHIAVSFTNLSAPYGRINWELIAFDLPTILASLSLATMGLGHKKAA